MKFNCYRASELSQSHLDAWRRLQDANAVYDSPFFSPEFTLHVAAARPDVRVLVGEADGPSIVFPFQVNGWGIGRPVAWRLNDFHGPIIAPGIEVGREELLRAAGLWAWHFDHLAPSLVGVTNLPPQLGADSPYLDLHEGFSEYCQRHKKAGSSSIEQIWRKERKLAREVGNVRFEMHTVDDRVFELLLEWKIAQLRRTSTRQILNYPWVQKVVAGLRSTASDSFSGQLSALYAGDELVAAHLGLRTRTALHWWITAYSEKHAAYSPGVILLLRLAEAAAAAGIQRLDLGKGTETYKQRLMSGAFRVGEGAISRLPGYSRCHRVALIAVRGLAESPLSGTFRMAKRAFHAMEARCIYRPNSRPTRS